jgi:hypothetical protein
MSTAAISQCSLPQQAFEGVGPALQSGDLQGTTQATHAPIQTFGKQSPFPLPWPEPHPVPPVKGPEPTPVPATGVNGVA